MIFILAFLLYCVNTNTESLKQRGFALESIQADGFSTESKARSRIECAARCASLPNDKCKAFLYDKLTKSCRIITGEDTSNACVATTPMPHITAFVNKMSVSVFFYVIAHIIIL